MFPIELDAEPKKRHSEQWNSRGETFRPFEHSWLPGKQIPARRTSKQLPPDSSQSVRSVMQTELMKCKKIVKTATKFFRLIWTSHDLLEFDTSAVGS